jgi:hypothetical protein
MLPEISRRCLKCGAAVRTGARFCPQCGQEFWEAGQPQTYADGSDAASAHGEAFGASADEGIESLVARLSAELSGGGAPKTRDVEAMRDVAPTTRDAYVPAREEEGTIEREGIDESDAVGAAPSSWGEVGADATVASAVEDDDGVSAVEGDDEVSAVEGRGRVARVRENARVRVESTKARAAKMRDEALVVLEETPDDSGLRFVLVAVGVFIIFVLLLFFSTSVLR